MPKAKDGRETTDLPSTLERSDQHAQHTWQKVHDAAVESYGEGERAHRTAFAALKDSYEKVGDHWEAKESRGPSDERSAKSTPEAARGEGQTHGGVDANASVDHLRKLARRLGVKGRSKMRKAELVDAIDRANDLATARARGD